MKKNQVGLIEKYGIVEYSRIILSQWYFTGRGFHISVLFSKAKYIGMFVICEVFHTGTTIQL